MRLTYKLEKPINTKYLHYDYMIVADYDISRGNYGKITDSEIYNKLGQLEDIEEKLGIDLVIGVTALVNGIYTQQFGFISGDSLVLGKYRIGIPSKSIWLPFTGPVGYGKTWTLALAKEGSKA